MPATRKNTVPHQQSQWHQTISVKSPSSSVQLFWCNPVFPVKKSNYIKHPKHFFVWILNYINTCHLSQEWRKDWLIICIKWWGLFLSECYTPWKNKNTHVHLKKDKEIVFNWDITLTLQCVSSPHIGWAQASSSAAKAA